MEKGKSCAAVHDPRHALLPSLEAARSCYGEAVQGMIDRGELMIGKPPIEKNEDGVCCRTDITGYCRPAGIGDN
jgi:hypothetical protein